MGGSKWNSQSDRYSKEETTCISRLHSGQNSRDLYYEQYQIMSWQISHILYQYLLCTTCHTHMEFSASMLTNTPSPTIFSARFCSRPRPAPRHAARSVAKCSSAWSPASFNRFDASDANRPLPRNIAKMMESDGIFGKSRLCVESSWDRWCHDCIWQRIHLLKSKKGATKKNPQRRKV